MKSLTPKSSPLFTDLVAALASIRSSNAIINTHTLSDLCSLDRPDDRPATFLEELFEEFQQNANLSISNLAEARSNSDLVMTQHLAHRLKGMSHNIGAQRLAAVSELIESAAAVGRVADDAVFSALNDDFEGTKEALGSYIQNKRQKTPKPLDSSLNLLLSAMNDQAVFTTDAEGLVKSWNRGAEQIIGYKQNEIIGQHFSIFYPVAAREKSYPDIHLQTAISSGKFEEEGIRIRKDGSAYWAHVVIIPAYDESGHLTGFVNFRRDITAYKQNQLALKRSQTRLQAFFENAYDAIGFLDAENRLTECNPAFCKLVGRQKAEITTDLGYQRLTPFEFHSEDLAKRQELISGTSSVQYEKEIMRHDGSRVPVHVTLFRLGDADQEEDIAAVILLTGLPIIKLMG